jgi:hypothetical protein
VPAVGFWNPSDLPTRGDASELTLEELRRECHLFT